MTRVAAILALAAAVFALGGAGRQATPAATSARIGDLFPVMPWEIQPEKQVLLEEAGHGLDSMRACGFDTVAFLRPDQVGLAEKAGLRAIVGRLSDLRLNWGAMSDRAIAEHVRAVVRASGDSDALVGYLLADEPSADEFAGLGKAVAAVKELAPGRLAYVNLYPSYASRAQLGTKTYTEYIERYVRVVKPQVLSYDNYDVLLSLDMANRARAAEYYTNLLAIRRIALKHGLPFWNALSSNRIRPHTTVPSPANLLLQAYTSLAAGSRGLTWFTYHAGRYAHAPVDNSGNRTATWSYLRMVNEQVQAFKPIMRRLRSTGVYFSKPVLGEGLRALPGALVKSVRSPTGVMVGEFSGEKGERYAMVVNLSLTRSAKIVVRTPSKTVRHISPVDRSATRLPSDGSLWLPAGQGALLKL
jgi:hypothetical protein